MCFPPVLHNSEPEKVISLKSLGSRSSFELIIVLFCVMFSLSTMKRKRESSWADFWCYLSLILLLSCFFCFCFGRISYHLSLRCWTNSTTREREKELGREKYRQENRGKKIVNWTQLMSTQNSNSKFLFLNKWQLDNLDVNNRP